MLTYTYANSKGVIKSFKAATQLEARAMAKKYFKSEVVHQQC